jgi:hypothetical protein
LSLISLYQVSENAAIRPSRSGRAGTYVENSLAGDILVEEDNSLPEGDNPVEERLGTRSRRMLVVVAEGDNSPVAVDSPVYSSKV